ncbi:serine/threonine-protein kinase SBK2-like isoform X2 [Syngnathoides biaculeatus]|uniref:serine/threonine-protein kinase SBK2-like isoform X2 n=1 Tax=Syngnathoides biaculeatus TaxID=300417 RepID=UPI002ADD4496|nr:serine/threonine-protein kinase SBK2-like isoform X2 [Syngnathoides biaculeatus]
MTAAARLLDDVCHLTAQSLNRLETSEHFRVVKMLGEGSYGKVVLAVHNQSGSPMALKFFPRATTSLCSFLREYNLSLRFCTHPSLSRALGIAYLTPSHYVFAQQAGLFGDLYDFIVPEAGVEEDRCQRVVSQLSGALSHLHSLGFVHRDVKPENVFLCDAACRWVKLGDFGMAKARGTKVPEVWYRSPYCTPEAETARGDGDGAGERSEPEEKKRGPRVWASVEPSVDSWALGVLTYAMLTGAHPWPQTSSDCGAYLKYLHWFRTAKSPEEELDLWAEPQHQGPDGTPADFGAKEQPSVAPQFARFTPLGRAFFRLLLNPGPADRGRPEDALGYLGGAWVPVGERERLEERRKKSRGGGGGGAVNEVKLKDGRGLR